MIRREPSSSEHLEKDAAQSPNTLGERRFDRTQRATTAGRRDSQQLAAFVECVHRSKLNAFIGRQGGATRAGTP